jgi:hypothetical protein
VTREWFIGFHKPVLMPRLVFGHCEAWGCDDDTWTFIDPQGAGLKVYTKFRHDDVRAELAARIDLCHLILAMPAPDRDFRLPLHGPMTCAAICGSLVGIRALIPATLRRSLLANGAEVFHDPEGKFSGQGRAPAGTPHGRTGADTGR